MTTYFEGVDAVKYEGTETNNPFAFRYYNKDQVVLGKTMAEHLRMAVCYWHSFCWDGADPFGQGTFERSWHNASSVQEATDIKMDVAFEFFAKLGLPYYCFHDVDVAGHLETPDELSNELARAVDRLQQKQDETGVKLLWGTANLFSHRRYMGGGLTNPDPEVTATAIRQVRECMDATFKLGGENYVLWGGREGYDTLLNTRLSTELDNFGALLNKVVEYKHKIGFKGKILIEPKPHEPTYHQYDFDTATVFGFLQRYGLEKEVHVNIEPNHATLAGHSFAHEIATAVSLGVMGSIDINSGNYQNGWDTDQFNVDIKDITLALIELLPSGGLDTGGFNFDAKVRRQSSDAVDLFHGHIGGADCLARALLAAADIIEKGEIEAFKANRYKGWEGDLGKMILSKETSLADIADHVKTEGINGKHNSGRQEYLENLINLSIK
ncbi:xylose isomerase [Hirschia baltica]|uniref:Xylose isomerase n=1 Tax=Hirschia baltica (strain ATCC 49814 / DSM 5838 / IFAM 1418) TaxID=582402 RepID=C6XQW7_HIRBI|nr:xylose isomerase [Hirschia baltica]ACT60498.1 xylose isomerase [Hirschia baltica ATCC 49814]